MTSDKIAIYVKQKYYSNTDMTTQVCMPQHTFSEVIKGFLQNALFCHVCNRSLYIISV